MNFQTLSQFMAKPFGNDIPKKVSNYEESYNRLKRNRDFKIMGYTQIDDEYLLHITVPSESNNGQIYDVVICFFTGDESVKKEATLNNYCIKFFSNSPAFIYQYATLYKINGFLIESLYEKMDSNYMDTMPDKANKDYIMYCDKTIYCACKLLSESKFSALSKFGIILHHKKTTNKFFNDIGEFQTTKFGIDSKDITKKIDKEIDESKKKNKENKKSGKRTFGKKVSVKSTVKNPEKTAITISKKIVAKNKTSSNKKKASKSTFKR